MAAEDLEKEKGKENEATETQTEGCCGGECKCGEDCKCDAECAEEAEGKVETNEETEEKDELTTLKEEKEKLHNDYIRLYADFENFKRRTAKERIEYTKTAGKDIVLKLLPLCDDVERAMAVIAQAEDIAAVKEGVEMIYSKFVGFLGGCDVKAIETEGKEFDTDFHEAIAKVPAGDEMKDKIVDCTQKGYMMGDKVIRFAKVVVGQ